jgi:ribosomal protein S19
MSRSKWKIPVINLNIQNKPTVKIWNRSNQILFKNLKNTVLVYDGKEFRNIRQEREKVGLKFSCFSFTRKHSKKLQNIKKNAKK